MDTWSHSQRDEDFVCVVFFTAMILTLVFALYKSDDEDAIPGRLGWIIVCILIQFAALVWYTLSYIPFAQQCVTRGCKQGMSDSISGV